MSQRSPADLDGPIEREPPADPDRRADPDRPVYPDRPIYLDHNATTPVDPRVLEAMLPFFGDEFANAASPHTAGKRAAEAVERARRQVAAALAADPREIVFTSGATEADNLAIRGVAASPAYAGRRRLVTVATEHPAVLEPCARLAQSGYDVRTLGVDSDGLLDLAELELALDESTLLVSVMLANNETGVLQPVGEIGRLCRQRRTLLHSDVTQAVGREPIDVARLGLHLASLSAHKLYGPKGVGALYVRRKGPRARCEPLQLGGGHERGYRSGTLNVPGIVGLGAAIELAVADREAEQTRLGALRDRLEEALLAGFPDARINGHRQRRLANTSNVSLDGVDAETLMSRVPEIAMSSSAACTSAKRLPSYVLRAMGRSESEIDGSLRLSLGRTNDEEQIDRAAARILAESEASRGRRCDPASAD